MLMRKTKVLTLPDSFFESPDLTGIQKFIYASLLLECDENNKANVSYCTMMKWTGLTRVTVTKHIKELEEAGYIKQLENRHRRSGNVYLVKHIFDRGDLNAEC